MRISRLRVAALALASGVILGGCAYDMYGDGYGYDPYGYGYGPRSSVSIGIGYGGGYGGYGYGGYGYGYPYSGYGYGSSYGGYDPFGWYGDYYYPGTGIYVYDRYRHRHEWNDTQRRYWESRRSRWQSHNGTSSSTTQNWSGWDRSRWRNHNNAASVTTTTNANEGSWRQNRSTRDSWQGRSSVTTRGEHHSDGGHRSAEREDERPN